MPMPSPAVVEEQVLPLWRRARKTGYPKVVEAEVVAEVEAVGSWFSIQSQKDGGAVVVRRVKYIKNHHGSKTNRVN